MRASHLWLSSAGAIFLCAVFLSVPGGGAPVAAEPAAPTLESMLVGAMLQPDAFVGSELCVRCHADYHEALESTPHGSSDFEALATRGCQSCHGAGRAHVQDPTNADTQPRIDRASLDDQREACLSCHTTSSTHDSEHAVAGVACSSCHSVHDWEAGVTGAAGDDRCLTCHTGQETHGGLTPAGGGLVSQAAPSQEARFRFRETPHSTLGCASCHTLGQLGTQTWDGRSGTERCLTCHGQSHPRFFASSHARAGLSCSSCHSVHSGDLVDDTVPDALVGRSSQSCIGCHNAAATEFTYNEHHRLEEGAMECSSCHNPHEPTPRVRLGGFKTQQCTQCHLDKQGPFVFEHGSSMVEGCTGCHVPHGSPNRFMLQFEAEGDLCFSCHVSMPGFHRNFTSQSTCTNCHATIHGSNLHPAFLN